MYLTLVRKFERISLPRELGRFSRGDPRIRAYRQSGGGRRTPNCFVLSPLRFQLSEKPNPTSIAGHLPACEASLLSPSLSPMDNSRSINELRSPALSKHWRARSKRHTANARSPTDFHFVSASSSGMECRISSAMSKSSSCKARSNLWSGSTATLRASSLRSIV